MRRSCLIALIVPAVFASMLPAGDSGLAPEAIVISNRSETVQRAPRGSGISDLIVDELVEIRLTPMEAGAEGVRRWEMRLENMKVFLSSGTKISTSFCRADKPSDDREEWEVWRKAVMQVRFKPGAGAAIETGYPGKDAELALGALPLRLRPYVRNKLGKDFLEILAAYCFRSDTATLRKGDRKLIDSGTPEEEREALRDIQTYVVEAVDPKAVKLRVTQDTRYPAPGYKRTQTDDGSVTVYWQSLTREGTETFDRSSGYVLDLDVISELKSIIELRDDGYSGREHGSLRVRRQAKRVRP